MLVYQEIKIKDVDKLNPMIDCLWTGCASTWTKGWPSVAPEIIESLELEGKSGLVEGRYQLQVKYFFKKKSNLIYYA